MKCPAKDCRNYIPDGKFMCMKHWTLLPLDLQMEIFEQGGDEPKMKAVTMVYQKEYSKK